MRQASQGDRSAFERVYYRYHRKLLDFFYGLSRSPQTAEDLCHDTFMRIWRLRADIRPRGRFRLMCSRLHEISGWSIAGGKEKNGSWGPRSAWRPMGYISPRSRCFSPMKRPQTGSFRLSSRRARSVAGGAADGVCDAGERGAVAWGYRRGHGVPDEYGALEEDLGSERSYVNC